MNKQTTAKSNKWDKFSHYFIRKEIPAKTTLLKEGQI